MVEQFLAIKQTKIHVVMAKRYEKREGKRGKGGIPRRSQNEGNVAKKAAAKYPKERNFGKL